MTTTAQIEWIRRNQQLITGPSLDVGSRIPETSEDSKIKRENIRSIVPDVFGVDLIDGPGVDVVADLSQPVGMWTDSDGNGFDPSGRFRTVFCLSVMEHVKDVFHFAENVTRLLAPGGWLFVSVPWVWRYHGHPHDYWRLSPHALRFLFRDLAVSRRRSEIWVGPDFKRLMDIRDTRPYADRKRQTLDTVTVNCLFRRKETP